MFAVIVCPHCTLVVGADLEMARITCPRCGRRIDVKRAKVYFSTDSSKELAEAVRQVGARLIYDIEVPGAPRPALPTPSKKPRIDEQSFRATMLSISHPDHDSTREELMKALSDREEEADIIITQMLKNGIIYEASPGRYRLA